MSNTSGVGFVKRTKKINAKKDEIISNDLIDLALIQCQLCGLKKASIKRLSSHLRDKHKLLFTSYKEQFGQPTYETSKVFHECCLCGERVLFDLDTISFHLRMKHWEVSAKEYNQTFFCRYREPK